MPDLMPPNFVNPDYASPEQIAQQRAYAKALQESAISGGAKTGIGAIAAALMGFQGQRGMGQANTQEQEANRAFSQQLMEATASKDPSKLMEVMANPRAAPLQALLARQLLEWGPPQRVTTPGGLTVEKPVAPWFGGTPVPTQRVTPQIGGVPPVGPTATPPGSVGDIVPGSRTTTGDSDETFDALGRQFGVPNLGALNKAGMEQAAQLKKQETAATLGGSQEQTAKAQEPMIAAAKERIVPLVSTVLNRVKGEGVWPPITGPAGFASSKYPGAPAEKNAKDVEDIKNILADLHFHELTIANPNRRIFPEEYESYKQSLGLDITDRQKLIKNLERLNQQFGGAAPSSSTTPKPKAGFGSANAADTSESPFEILHVESPATFNQRFPNAGR